MAEKRDRRLLPFIKATRGTDARRLPLANEDPALMRVLRQWEAPDRTPALDARVLASAERLLTPRRRRHRTLVVSLVAGALLCLVLLDVPVASAAVAAIRSSALAVIQHAARALSFTRTPGPLPDENSRADAGPASRSTDIVLPSEPPPATTARKSARPTGLPDLSSRLSLEVRALTLLSRADLLSGTQLTVRRNASGVRVEAITDTTDQKDKLLSALEAVAGLPGFTLDVREISETNGRGGAARDGLLAAREVEIVQDTPPLLHEAERWVEGRLRDQLNRQPMPAEIAAEVNQLANRALDQSRLVLVRSLSLSQIANRFSSTELQTMQMGTLEEWRSLVRRSADAVRRESHGLALSLQPFLWESGSVETERPTNESRLVSLESPEAAARAAKEIGALATETDQSVREALAFSARSSEALDRRRLALSLQRLEELATALVSWR